MERVLVRFLVTDGRIIAKKPQLVIRNVKGDHLDKQALRGLCCNALLCCLIPTPAEKPQCSLDKSICHLPENWPVPSVRYDPEVSPGDRGVHFHGQIHWI